MFPKPLAWLAMLALAGLTGCASYGMKLPAPPATATLIRDEPIFCADRTLYFHLYDTNPDTKAAVVVVGPTNEQHSHGAPFLVVVVSDDGTPEIYLSIEGTRAEKLTISEFNARYGGLTPESACSIAASVKA